MQPEPPRLLAVDNAMVVPVNKVVRVQTIGADVIHAFAVPSVRHQDRRHPGPPRRDLVPGHREGISYGQCSELCGKDHAYMPIREVRVVQRAGLSPPGSRTRRRNTSPMTASRPPISLRPNRTPQPGRIAIAMPSFKLLFLQLDDSAGRPHRQGHRQAVVLELQLPRQQFRVRLADAARTRTPSPTSRGCSPSTTRWWCRSTRWCACRSSAPTSSTPSRCPRSASRSTPSRAGSTRPGSRPRAKASTTASARNCAARTTPSCRSRCGW